MAAITTSRLELRLHDPCGILRDETIASFTPNKKGYRVVQKTMERFRRLAESDAEACDNLICVRSHAPVHKRKKAQ